MSKIASALVSLTVVLLMLFAGGCSLPGKSMSTSRGEGYNSFVDALKSKGYKIEEIKPAEGDKKHSFFSVYAKFIDADDMRLSVYEFKNSKKAALEAKTISKDGYSIGNSMIEWIDKPHFYLKDNLIVGYVGKNEKLLKDLHELLGKPITE